MNITPVKINIKNKDIYKRDPNNSIPAGCESINIEPINENLLPHDYGYHPNIYKIGTVPKYILPLAYGQVYDKSGGILNRHTTFFARDDLDWYDFGKYLKSKYEDISNVDIQCFGCSTGQEAYTLALLLKSIYGDSPFVIHASDIDKKTIKNNMCEQENGIYLNEDDYLKIIQTLAIDVDESGTCKDCLGRYFIERGQMRQIQPEIVNSVEFSKKNILTSTDELSKTKPSIVLCRNMWPYVNPDLYCEFAEKLYENLAEGSIVIIGQFDYHGEYGYENSSEFPNALEKAGFRLVYGVNKLLSDEKLVFEK